MSQDPRAGGGRTSRRAVVLLAAGGICGMALAAASLLGTDRTRAGALPRGAVARIGDTLLSADDYERALAALARDRRAPLGPEERRHVLDRLIDQELLVQRGIDLDLVRGDRFTRGALVNAVIAAVAGQAEEEEPTREALEAFYREHADFFASPGRLRLEQLFVRVRGPDDDASGRRRAREAAERLRAGEPLAAVRARLGDPEPIPLPDALLPPLKLREYLGPTPVRAALSLGVGEVGEPARSALGYHVLRVLDRQAAFVPPFDEIAAQVRAESRRRRGDQALRAYLDRLRQESAVVVAPETP